MKNKIGIIFILAVCVACSKQLANQTRVITETVPKNESKELIVTEETNCKNLQKYNTMTIKELFTYFPKVFNIMLIDVNNKISKGNYYIYPDGRTGLNYGSGGIKAEIYSEAIEDDKITIVITHTWVGDEDTGSISAEDQEKSRTYYRVVITKKQIIDTLCSFETGKIKSLKLDNVIAEKIGKPVD